MKDALGINQFNRCDIMLSYNKPRKGIVLTKEVHKVGTFRIRWKQFVSGEGEIEDIGKFQQKEKHHKLI